MKSIGNIIIILIFLVIGSNVSGQTTTTGEFNTYVINNSCLFKNDSLVKEEGCLESQKFRVRRKDGRFVNINHVYRYKLSDEPASKPMYPHFLLGYFKFLMGAIEDNQSNCLYINSDGNIKSDYDCISLLRDQLQFMESHADITDDLIFWEQGVEYPSGMAQAEMAYLYSKIAILLKNTEDHDAAGTIFEKALRISASLDIEQSKNNGGVRSRIFTGSGLRGWLYHSSRRTEQNFALNQQAHIIRDAIYFYYQYDLYLKSIEEEMSDDIRRRLISRFLVPLKTLTADNRPFLPNLTNYMQRITKDRVSYFWSYYEIDADTLEGDNIKEDNVCGYHHHSLELFYAIIAAFRIEPEKVSKRGLYNFLKNEENEYHKRMLLEMEAVCEVLLDTQRGPKGQRRLERMGLKNSNNALFQFFRSETTPKAKSSIQGCNHKNFDNKILTSYRMLFELDKN